jgi:uncharacterized protein involved in exopolysaccharide biosynthesis
LPGLYEIDMTHSFTPFDDFQRAAHRWWWLSLCLIGGALLGWLGHQFLPPIYQAQAVFVVGIDFTQFMGDDRDRYAEDHTIAAARELMLSKPVLQTLTDNLTQAGLSSEAFQPGRTLFAERRDAVILLIARAADPGQAAQAANAWADAAYAALLDAYQHALQAASLQGYLAVLSGCAAPAVEISETCSTLSLDEIEQRTTRLTAELAAELQASRGISPAIQLEYSQPAQTPSSPVLFRRPWLIWAGMVIGFWVGVMTPSFPQRKPR